MQLNHVLLTYMYIGRVEIPTTLMGQHFLVFVHNWKYRNNRNFSILVPKILSRLGSRQLRFKYRSFRFNLIWSGNSIEMKPNQHQNETNANNPPENLVPKPWYPEVGARNKVLEPKLGLYWKISTAPTLIFSQQSWKVQRRHNSENWSLQFLWTSGQKCWWLYSKF